MDPQDRRQDRHPPAVTPAELAEYQPLFDNAKKLRALLAELQDLTLQIIEEGARRAITPAEPEDPPPDSVGSARLTCGQHPDQSPFAQVSPKREDLTSSGGFSRPRFEDQDH